MTHMLVLLHRGPRKCELLHLRNFKSKHVVSILDAWRGAGLAASTMATYTSHLRTLVTWLEKPQLLEIVDQYCLKHPGLTKRTAATDRDKSERGAGVDLREIIRRAEETGDQHFFCQILLIVALGLRVREAFLFRPHLSVRADGSILVSGGTKGGRPRTLPVPPTPGQLAVIERAKAITPHISASMIPAGYRAVEWSRHFYRLCRRIGLTRRALGVTCHSLRHGALLDLFEIVSGFPAPVRDGDVRSFDRAVELSAREVVAEYAGHTRPQITSAYLGSSRRRRSRPPILAVSLPEMTQADESLPGAREVEAAIDASHGVVDEANANKIRSRAD
jgi:integrase